jgi:hypothetical protein
VPVLRRHIGATSRIRWCSRYLSFWRRTIHPESNRWAAPRPEVEETVQTSGASASTVAESGHLWGPVDENPIPRKNPAKWLKSSAVRKPPGLVSVGACCRLAVRPNPDFGTLARVCRPSEAMLHSRNRLHSRGTDLVTSQYKRVPSQGPSFSIGNRSADHLQRKRHSNRSDRTKVRHSPRKVRNLLVLAQRVNRPMEDSTL